MWQRPGGCWRRRMGAGRLSGRLRRCMQVQHFLLKPALRCLYSLKKHPELLVCATSGQRPELACCGGRARSPSPAHPLQPSPPRPAHPTPYTPRPPCRPLQQQGDGPGGAAGAAPAGHPGGRHRHRARAPAGLPAGGCPGDAGGPPLCLLGPRLLSAACPTRLSRAGRRPRQVAEGLSCLHGAGVALVCWVLHQQQSLPVMAALPDSQPPLAATHDLQPPHS